MTPRPRRRPAQRIPARAPVAPLALVPAAATRGESLVRDLQHGWWIVGLLGALVAALGFQALPPSSRLTVIERVNARQDSVFAAEAAAQRQTLDTIRRQVGQLLAGQCVKERDRMARLLYDCEGR